MDRYTKTKSIATLIIIFISYFFFAYSVCAAPLSPDSLPIKKAMSYFKANQKDDGGFGPGGVTEWVMMAISAAGQDPRGWYKNGNTPIDYLRNQTPTQNPYDWIRMILALISVGENPKDFYGINYIQKIKHHYQGDQFGDPLSLRDDYWVVLALVSAGEKYSRHAQDSARFILSHQNQDGSWSASTTGVEACADNTAIAMVALISAGHRQSSEAIMKGLTYLRKVQTPDGGFSYLFMPSNAASDSWVIQALCAVGEDPSRLKVGTIDVITHLLKLQQEDGSFTWTAKSANSSLLMTAYAIPALVGKWYPINHSKSDLITLGLRVEGENTTILHTQLTHGPSRLADSKGVLHPAPFPTPLSVLVEAAVEEKIDHLIENSGAGLFLKSLAGETNGWQYRVNDRLPMAPANEYRLKSGDEVIWFYDYHGRKSPLRILPDRFTAWEGEKITFRIDQFSDATDQWKPASEAVVVVGTLQYSASHGEVTIPFNQKGLYHVYAQKEGAIRSPKKTITVEELCEVKVKFRIEDNGRLLCQEKVSFSCLKTRDINGRAINIKRPVVIGVLEAAKQKGLLTYRVIQTAEGLILVDINRLAENNQNGSWWYQVNGKHIFEDIDEYELNDGETIVFYRSKHPKKEKEGSFVSEK